MDAVIIDLSCKLILVVARFMLFMYRLFVAFSFGLKVDNFVLFGSSGFGENPGVPVLLGLL